MTREDYNPQQELPAQNIARQRTFTEELRGLIGKIEDHEHIAASPMAALDDESLHTLTMERVARRLHELYYRTQMTDDFRHTFGDFNPFHESENVPEKDLDHLSRYITGVIAREGFDAYSLMCYDPCAGCYTRWLGNDIAIPGEGFIIGLKHPVFKKIHDAERGAFISIDELRDDPFYGKITDWTRHRDTGIIFAIMADRITRTARLEFSPEHNGKDEFFPGPLLILIANKKEPDPSLYLKLQSLAVPLLFLKTITKETAVTTVRQQYDIIKGYADILSADKTGHCMIIGSDHDTLEGMYIIRFVEEICRRLLSHGSIIMPVRMRRLILFCHDRSIHDIETAIHDLNRYCDGILFIRPIDVLTANSAGDLAAGILQAL